MISVEQALKRLARFNGAAGSCWDAPSNLRKLNDAVSLIFERGDFEGTMEYGCIRCQDGCFYLPHYLQTIRTAWLGTKPYPVFNHHYMAFDNVTRAKECSSRTLLHFQSTGIRRPIVATPTFKSYAISAIAGDPEDDGVELSFEVQSKASRRHLSLTLSKDGYADTSESVNDIISVTKPITKGRVSLSAKDILTGNREHLAEYPAKEENPLFSQYRLFGNCSSCCVIVVHAKKKFYELEQNSELVPIESVQALRFAYQALNAQERQDNEAYVQSINLMESHLSEADENISESEPSVSANVSRVTALNPHYD